MKVKQWLNRLNILNKQIDKYCLICFEKMNKSLFINSFICDSCLKSMNPEFKKIKMNDLCGYAIYPYQESVKELLYKFKGCNDIVLKNVFINQYKLLIEIMFFNYVIVYVPSSDISNIRRGFNHVVEMFSCLKNQKIYCIEKIEDIKQSSLDKNKRAEIGNYLRLNEKVSLIKNKNILIVDDVLTTGSTINACYKLLKNFTNKKIKFLVMSYVCR